MKQLLLILSFTLGLTTAAQAGFNNNRVDWSSLPLIVKEAYAMGLHDGFIIHSKGDSGNMKRWKTDLSRCSAEMPLKIPNLVELIDNYYLDTSNWKQPPVVALTQAMNKVCDIN